MGVLLPEDYMEKWNPGVVCYHKATNFRCVVISSTEDLVKVRDEENKEQEYYPQELETEAEIESKQRAMNESVNRANNDRDFDI